MGACGSTPKEAPLGDTQRLIKTDVDKVPWEESKPQEVHEIPEDELTARVVKRSFLLLTGLFYTVISGLVLIIPGAMSEGFPLYLSKELLADQTAMNFLDVAVAAAFLRGIGYFTLAGNNYEEIMFASMFNKALLAITAGVWWSQNQLPTSLFVFVMVGDFGSMLITLLLMIMYPATIRRERRVLLWVVPPKLGRPIRAYFLEFEGYFGVFFYLLLSIPTVARMFEVSPEHWVGGAGTDEQTVPGTMLPSGGHRLGMFQIACFWLANMYWYYIPGGRRASRGVMAMAWQQRLFLFAWWLYQHFIIGDHEHNLINTVGTCSFLFLAADLYNWTWFAYFSPIDEAEQQAHVAEGGEKSVEDGAGAASTYLMYTQPTLPYHSRWVVANAGNLVLISQLWMWLSTTGWPYIHYTYQLLPGHMDLAYKLHLTDWSLVLFQAVLALLLFPLVPRHPTSQLVLKTCAYVFPLLAWWYALEAKILMHLRGGSPWLVSWIKMGLGTHFTDIAVDITFYIGFVSFKLVAVLLAAAVSLYALGAPWKSALEMLRAKSVRDASPGLKKFLLQNAVLLVLFSGFWMLLAATGIPSPNGSTQGASSAPAPVDPRVAVEVHRYDLLLAIALPLGGWVLAEATHVGYAQGAAVTLAAAAWWYALAVKISAHTNSAPSFHQSWVDMFGVPAFANAGSDTFSWLGFVLLNFVAFPLLLPPLLMGASWDKVRAYNRRAHQMTTIELLHFNRSMFLLHAALLLLVGGLWAVLTSSGLWAPAGKTGAAFGSFEVANPAVLKVGMQDIVSALSLALVGVLLDFVPVHLTGERQRINSLGRFLIFVTWFLTLMTKLMVNIGEDDMLTWPGMGAFGEWRDPASLSVGHNIADFIWYIATLLGRVSVPVVVWFLIRNSIINSSRSLAAKFVPVHTEPEEKELYFGVLFLQLMSTCVAGTSAYKLFEWLSHVVSPPERQYLTVDRIAYSMQEPSRTLRRKWFKAVGVAKDEHGWWFCSQVPEEIEAFQRNEILAAMSAHTIQKAPGTFFEIIRARAFNSAPDWMVWQPLTDSLWNDIFHSRFGAELVRKATAQEVKHFNDAMSNRSSSLVHGNTAQSRLRGGAMRAVVKNDPGASIVVADLTKLMEGAQRKPTDHVYPTPGMKFYFTAGAGGLKARAIEMYHLTGKVDMYYNDGSAQWEFAKRAGSTALITAHQIGVHLTHGHFLAESQVVLTYKWLHVDHWLFKWIEPLAGDVQFINETWGKEAILYGTIMDMGPLTTQGLVTVIENAKTSAFEGDLTWHLMERLKPEHSGVPLTCPWNYRTTATILEGFVRKLATAVADKHYKVDDIGLRNFMKTCYWWRQNPSWTPTTKEGVIEYMVQFFMNASYRHDYAHDDYLWHVAKSLPPQLMPSPDPEVPASYLPSKAVYAMTLQIAHALQAGVIETPLEAYYSVYPEPDMRPHVDTFVSEVQSLLVLGGVHEHMNQCGSMTH